MFCKHGRYPVLIALALCLSTVAVLAQTPGQSIKGRSDFSFIVTADIREFAAPRYQSPGYFPGACEAIHEVGKGAFMISPGDNDPPWHVRATMDRILGSDYPWFPVMGNHETDSDDYMAWFREWGRGEIPFLVRRGPENSEETTYSFDYETAHFVAINQYYDGRSDTGTDGDVSDALYDWLKMDLENTQKPLIFIFGHEPAVSVPDIDNGRVRHVGDSLDKYTSNNHRFQILMREHRVKAYFCGHTHNASYAFINGVWQIDAGHTRGMGDLGAPSTFLKVWVKGAQSLIEFYRDDGKGGDYSLSHSVVLF